MRCSRYAETHRVPAPAAAGVFRRRRTISDCGNCDNCLDPPERWDASVVAQKALSCVYRTGQRFGVVHLTPVLRGEADDRITRLRHDQL